jgi:hypothetical protein
MEKLFSPTNVYKSILTILLAIVSFFLVNTFTRLTEVQRDLAKTQVSIAEINAKLLTREDIHEIAR